MIFWIHYCLEILFKSRVEKYGIGDYMYRSPANRNEKNKKLS